MITVILPTYNEADNIGVIIPLIHNCLNDAKLEHEILIIDDNSPDNTATTAQNLQSQFPVRVFVRHFERGLASAVIQGFEMAKGDICVVMDADLSHPVSKLPEMISPIISDRSDIVVGSRYIQGGGVAAWTLPRRIASRFAGYLAKGISKLSDPTSGFMAVKKSCLKNVPLNPIGWKIVLEVVSRTNVRVTEVPIMFTDRVKGSSKLTAKIHAEYLIHLWRLYGLKTPTLTQFIKFCLVGLSGLVVDTLVLVGAVELLGYDPRLAAVPAFVIAISWNFVLNRIFTFNYDLGLSAGKSFFHFFLVCVFGLIARLVIMHLLLSYTAMSQGKLYIVASIIGITGATLVNFFGSKVFAFPEDKTLDESR